MIPLNEIDIYDLFQSIRPKDLKNSLEASKEYQEVSQWPFPEIEIDIPNGDDCDIEECRNSLIREFPFKMKFFICLHIPDSNQELKTKICNSLKIQDPPADEEKTYTIESCERWLNYKHNISFDLRDIRYPLYRLAWLNKLMEEVEKKFQYHPPHDEIPF